MGRTRAAAAKETENVAPKKKQSTGTTESSSAEKTTDTVAEKRAPAQEFWIKTFTEQQGVIILFSEEVLGPFETKEHALKAIDKEVEKIGQNYDLELSEEDFVADYRKDPPSYGKVVVIKNVRECYHIHLSTEKPKVFDGADSDGPFSDDSEYDSDDMW